MKKYIIVLFVSMLISLSSAFAAEEEGMVGMPEVVSQCYVVFGGQEGTGSNKVEENGSGQNKIEEDGSGQGKALNMCLKYFSR